MRFAERVNRLRPVKIMELVDLKRQQKHLRQRIEARIMQVLDHGDYILGPEVSKLEELLATYVGVPYCLTCSSGSDALLIALMVWGVGPGDAVFVPALTFFATAEAVSRTGATPIFVDIDPRTFTIDAGSLDEAYQVSLRKGLRPRAVIPVNLFGQLAEYPLLGSFAQRHELFVLEDAAQSFGARQGSARACSFGDIGCTSFYPAKPLGCYGDGGAIFCSNPKFFDAMCSIRVHGQGAAQYLHREIGMTGRLDTIQAAILLEKLSVFDDELRSRETIAQYYSREIGEPFIVPYVRPGTDSVWAQYSLLHGRRDEVIEHLKRCGIPARIYYPVPLHLQEVYRGLGYSAGSLPHAEEIARHIFSIPMHPYLERQEQDRVIEALRTFT